jgi:hypothetical protein
MFLFGRAAIAALTCSALAVFAGPALAVTTIDTGVGTGSSLCSWGYPDTATYGQTFVAPAGDTVLDRFSFHMIRGGDQTATIDYRAYVYRWDVDRATGASVWESSPRQVTLATDDYLNPQQVATDTGGVALESGGTYVAFLSTSADYELNDETDVACWSPAASPYAGGGFVFNNDSGDEFWWTNTYWGDAGGDDLAFNASFRAP